MQQHHLPADELPAPDRHGGGDVEQQLPYHDKTTPKRRERDLSKQRRLPAACGKGGHLSWSATVRVSICAPRRRVRTSSDSSRSTATTAAGITRRVNTWSSSKVGIRTIRLAAPSWLNP